MKLLDEFRQFALKGNMLDMAIGIIVGGAFGKVVTSLVNDILLPPIGLLLGGTDFSALAWTLKPNVGDIPAVTLNYGLFIQNIIDFLIIAVAVFFMVKGINKMIEYRRKKDLEEAVAKEPELSKEELLLTEIRDILKHQ